MKFHVPPNDQRWFWTAAWQRREGEVDARVAADEVDVHIDGDAFLDHLDRLNADYNGQPEMPSSGH
ncbi:hypothetical protein ACRDU6_09430 [Mycolicibacterium sp. ELW1]|uniref:hypothetical protein n=1 Tax=Mycobacteriaceae TaxID=1762 RepID=UPI0011EFB339|nr:hypothetical protein [Mycobacterium sp. ELW1]QEN12877.1 hypothetical protein D3H54_05970 [Mycobacterium sp. ELW1]